MKIVVYHPFPTSNHNCIDDSTHVLLLYIILFLHQTTTEEGELFFHQELYIILFLHQTTTFILHQETTKQLYIILFLHQTTTVVERAANEEVVYHPFPTSNHNHAFVKHLSRLLYIILFLHQTTTAIQLSRHSVLYIILFLHQTTTY